MSEIYNDLEYQKNQGMRFSGSHTIQELLDGSRAIKKQIDETGEYPFSSSKEEWMFIGDMAIYKPYIPLQMTPLPEEWVETLEESKSLELNICEQCGEEAWDGYICHSCGLKRI